jgi:hypothetical protein
MVDIYQYDKKKEEQTIIKTDTGKRKKDTLKPEKATHQRFFAVKLKKPNDHTNEECF